MHEDTTTSSVLATAELRFEERQIELIRARAAFAKSHHEHIRVPVLVSKLTVAAAVAGLITWLALGPQTPAGNIAGLALTLVVSAGVCAVGYLAFAIAVSRAAPSRVDVAQERFEIEAAALERLRARLGR